MRHCRVDMVPSPVISTPYKPDPIVPQKDDVTVPVTTKDHPLSPERRRPLFPAISARCFASAVRPASVIARASAGHAASMTLGRSHFTTYPAPRSLLSRHPRWTFHFTPTSASWLNAVEDFFSKMTRQRIRRGVFRSIADLQAAINAYLAEHNARPKPFVWTKSTDSILAKLDRCPVPSV
jgi:transposase